MNSIDYAKALAEQRDMYRRASNENRESHKKIADEMQSTFDMRNQKTKENYHKAKIDQEETYNRDIGRASDRAKDIIQETKKVFHDNLKNERDRFGKDLEQNKTQFRQKLDDLSDSFQLVKNSEQETHQKIQDESQRNHTQQSSEQSRNYEKVLKEFTDQTSSRLKAGKEQELKESQNLAKDYQEKMHLVKKEEATRRIRENRLKDDQIEKTKLMEERDRLARNENHSKALDNNRTLFNGAITRQQENFDRLGKELMQDNLEDKEKSKDWFSERITNIDKQNATEKDTLKKQFSVAREHGQQVEKEYQKGSPGPERIQHLVDQYKKEMEETKKKVYRDSEKERVQILDGARQDRLKDSAENQKDFKEVEAGHRLEKAKTQLEKERLVDHYDKNSLRDRQRYQDQTQAQEGRHENSLRNETAKSADRMENLIKDHSVVVGTVKEYYGQKNKELTIKQEKALNTLLKDLTEEFQQRLGKNAGSFEEKLRQQEKFSNDTTTSFEDRIKRLQTQRKREIEYSNHLSTEQFEANEEAKKALLNAKNQDFQIRIDALRREYSERITDIINDQDRKMKSAVDALENRLENISSEGMRNNLKTQAAHRREMNSLKQDNEMTINNLKTIYEDKISTLKEEYENRIEKLKSRIK